MCVIGIRASVWLSANVASLSRLIPVFLTAPLPPECNSDIHLQKTEQKPQTGEKTSFFLSVLVFVLLIGCFLAFKEAAKVKINDQITLLCHMVAFDQAVICGEIQHFIIPRQHKWFRSKKIKTVIRLPLFICLIK